MKWTRAKQEAYRKELNSYADSAAEFVDRYIQALATIEPDASVAELREGAISAIKDSLNIFGEQAEELSNDLFDEIMKNEGIDATSRSHDVISNELMAEKVHYFARKLIEGDLPGFTKDVADLTRFYVHRSAFENMIRNCDENDIRYARIPSGRETCAFCFMLSSRGFVYHSENTARGNKLHGMHNHCDCIIAPGVDGKTRIEGYNPDAMYERWKQCAKTVDVDPKHPTTVQRKKIMDEVSKRDWRWLYSGAEPEPVYQKHVDDLTDDEKACIQYLVQNGLKPIVLEEDPNAEANIDLEINGHLWEVKNIGDGKHSIDDRLKDAYRKWRKLGLDESEMKVVITTEGRTKSIESAADEITRRLRKGQECLLFDQKGNMIRIRK